MSKVVVFDIRNGDFEQGFEVTLRIRKEDGNDYRVCEGRFPAAPNIPKLYRNFQSIYKSLGQRAIECESNQITNVSTIKQFQEAADALEVSLREWFEHYYTRELRVWVEEEVGKEESAQIIFLTSNEIFKKLPWHLWQLFQNREKVWFSLGAEYNHASEPLKYPVNILAILGSDKEINLTQDEKILINLPGAKVKPLKQPTREKLCSELRDNPWDILCFAGHSITSSNGNDGAFQLNDTDSPSPENLKNAFKKAIKKGLKLAIFNSCDGLGLASKLTQLGIPQVIVMREPVPDEVAQKFLKEFLRLFSQGEKFHLAMRQAQERLEEIEHKYPYASWLPVICQNPSEKSLLWRQPIHVRIKRGIKRLWRSHKIATLVSLLLVGALTAIIIKQIFTPTLPTPRIITKTHVPLIINTKIPEQNSASLDNFFSQGEKILVKSKSNPNKEKGTIAFQQEDWNSAINEFRSSLKQTPNDPESLVYLNNAIAMKNGNPLKIAVAVPVGQRLGKDEEVLRGIAHAQSKLNCRSIDNIVKLIKNNQTNLCQGSIKGRPLLVEIVNDKGNADTAIKVARKIVNDKNKDNILALIGHRTSEITFNAVENEYQDKLLVVSPTSNSVRFDTNSNMVLRTVINNSYEMDEFNKKFVKSKFNGIGVRVIVAYEKGDTFSDSLKRGFETIITSLSNSTFDEYKFDDDNYSTQELLALIQEKNANVLLLAPSAKDETVKKALQVVKEISISQNNGNLILLGSSTMYSPMTTSLENGTYYGKASETTKLVIFTPWHRSNSDFEKKEAKNLWGNVKINWITAMAYDATKVVIEGLDKVGEQASRQQLRENLLRNINNFSVQGATTKIEFEPGGGRKRSDGLGVLVQVKCKISSCDFENLDSK